MKIDDDENIVLDPKEISPNDIEIIKNTLIYETWRHDGKNDHIKRDIKKKIIKTNAKINEILNEGNNPVSPEKEILIKIKHCS